MDPSHTTDRFVSRAARLGVLAIFATLALMVVIRCGYRYPFSDDWDLIVPILDGERGIAFSWLWAQHNEHRLPLTKLILIASDIVSGGDFRGAVIANWAMLVAIAAVLCRSAWRLVGRPAVVGSILIGALILNPSNNALRWGVEGQFVASALLVITAISGILGVPSISTISIVGASSTLLPLTGGNGALFSLSGIAATLYCAMQSRKTNLRVLALTLATINLLVLGAYFYGYIKPPNHESLGTSSIVSACVVFVHLLVAPFGAHCSRLIGVTAPLALAALAISGVILWRGYQSDRSSRPIVVAVLLVALGTALVFGAIAFARGGRGWPPGLETHYASLGIPLWGLLCVGLIARGARILPAALAVVALGAFVLELPLGPPPPYVAMGAGFREAWCNGRPESELSARYIRLFYYVDTPSARDQIESQLRAIRSHAPTSWRCPGRSL